MTNTLFYAAAQFRAALPELLAAGLVSFPPLSPREARLHKQRMCMDRLRAEQRGKTWDGPARIRRKKRTRKQKRSRGRKPAGATA